MLTPDRASLVDHVAKGGPLKRFDFVFWEPNRNKLALDRRGIGKLTRSAN
jgi:hypothetical protein